MSGSSGTEAGTFSPVVFPRPVTLFERRSARFRALSAATPSLSGYLSFLATLTGRQAESAGRLHAGQPAGNGLRALDVGHQPRDPVWKAVLHEWVLDVSPEAASLADTLRRLSMATSAELDQWADAMLAGTGEAGEAGLWPFIAAALQVVWVTKASQLSAADFADVGASHECPACGSLPVAGLLKSGGNLEGLRYLHCGLCATEWHRPRIHCTYCGSSERVTYHAIEGAGDAVRAETCDACRSYSKLISLDKNPTADPCADDVATLGLDVLMNEQSYSRLGCNFFLIPSLPPSS